MQKEREKKNNPGQAAQKEMQQYTQELIEEGMNVLETRPEGGIVAQFNPMDIGRDLRQDEEVDEINKLSQDLEEAMKNSENENEFKPKAKEICKTILKNGVSYGNFKVHIPNLFDDDMAKVITSQALLAFHELQKEKQSTHVGCASATGGPSSNLNP